MAFEQREMSGSLFRNEDRKTESHPNASGKALIDGVLYFVDAWTKEGTKGKWQSLSFKRADKQPASPPPAKGDRFYGTDDDFKDPPF